MANAKSAVAARQDEKIVKKKGKTGLIVLIVFVLFIAGGVTAVAVNLFGLRDNFVFPLLRNVPLVGGLIPEAEETEDEPDLTLVIADLEYEIAALTEEHASRERDLEILNEMLVDLMRENAWLQEYETMHNAREAANDEFQRALAENEPDAFMEFFATMHPALQAEIYRELASGIVDEQLWRNYVAMWGAANATLVAQAIETMIATNMPLIVSVLTELTQAQAAAILNALETESRAAVLRQMDPR